MPLQFELGRFLVGLQRNGEARRIDWESGPPPRIDGYVVGLSATEPGSPPRHNGERHPDADEVLFLISGLIDVVVEGEDGVAETTTVTPDQAFVVPRGLWHRIITREPSRLLHITPGPGAEWRPVQGS